MKRSLIIDPRSHTVLSGSFFRQKTMLEDLPQVINIQRETWFKSFSGMWRYTAHSPADKTLPWYFYKYCNWPHTHKKEEKNREDWHGLELYWESWLDKEEPVPDRCRVGAEASLFGVNAQADCYCRRVLGILDFKGGFLCLFLSLSRIQPSPVCVCVSARVRVCAYVSVGERDARQHYGIWGI